MMHKSLLKKLGLVVVVVALVVGCGAGQGYQSTSQGPLGLTDKSKTGISFWDGKYSCNDNGHCPFDVKGWSTIFDIFIEVRNG